MTNDDEDGQGRDWAIGGIDLEAQVTVSACSGEKDLPSRGTPLEMTPTYRARNVEKYSLNPLTDVWQSADNGCKPCRKRGQVCMMKFDLASDRRHYLICEGCRENKRTIKNCAPKYSADIRVRYSSEIKTTRKFKERVSNVYVEVAKVAIHESPRRREKTASRLLVQDSFSHRLGAQDQVSWRNDGTRTTSKTRQSPGKQILVDRSAKQLSPHEIRRQILDKVDKARRHIDKKHVVDFLLDEIVELAEKIKDVQNRSGITSTSLPGRYSHDDDDDDDDEGSMTDGARVDDGGESESKGSDDNSTSSSSDDDDEEHDKDYDESPVKPNLPPRYRF